MRQILYISTARKHLTPNDVGDILRSSHRNNTLSGVTGLLFYDGVRFMQVLEGPSEKIEETFSRIRADKRHYALVILHDIPMAERQFRQMTMASYVWDSNEGPASVSHDKVDRLVADVEDQNLKYQFKSFAQIRG